MKWNKVSYALGLMIFVGFMSLVFLVACSESPETPTPKITNKNQISRIWSYQDTTDVNTIVKCYNFDSGGGSCVVIENLK